MNNDNQKEVGFISHLVELRKRLIHSFFFLVGGWRLKNISVCYSITSTVHTSHSTRSSVIVILIFFTRTPL